MKVQLIIFICLTTFHRLDAASETEKPFTQVAKTVVVANEAFTRANISRLWPSASDAWTPKKQLVLEFFRELDSKSRRQEIIEASPSGVDMTPALAAFNECRFQVFGLVIKNKRFLLIDASPIQSDGPDIWLKNCVSCSVFDGGSHYWSVLARGDTFKVISSGKRPR